MYANFILTQGLPAIANPGGELVLGELSSGIFLVPVYPAWLTFGGIVEVSFGPDEAGIHEVELVGTVVGTPESHVLSNWPIEIQPADAGWTTPVTRTFAFPAEMAVSGDLEMTLDVLADRHHLTSRCILVRSFSL